MASGFCASLAIFASEISKQLRARNTSPMFALSQKDHVQRTNSVSTVEDVFLQSIVTQLQLPGNLNYQREQGDQSSIMINLDVETLDK